MENRITKIKKRDGTIVDFDQQKITNAIFKAITASGEDDGKKSKEVSDKVVQILNRRFKKDEIPNVEQIQDIVEEVLILENLIKTAKAYILYREQRRRIREAVKASEEAVERVDQYLEKLDWEVQENANMAFSLQGLNHYGVSYIIKKYWLNKIYPKEIREANESGDLHLHDLDALACYCSGWDLYDLLLKGFRGVPGKIETKPAKHFRAILGQVVNFLYTIQGEVAGAVAFSNFDTLLSPFIRYDNLSYREVKQSLQEFLFNMAVPTRVGFQSLAWDELVIIKEKGKINFVEIGKLIDKKFEESSHRVIEQHPQSFAVENYDDCYTLSFNSQGKAVWAKIKAFIRHKVPKNSKFVKVRTNRGEAKISTGHSLFSFKDFKGKFNPQAVSVSDVKTASDYRHLNSKNHFLALSKIETPKGKGEIDLIELIDAFPQLQKNVFVKINPTHTLSVIRSNILNQYQAIHPFYIDFGIRDKGIWKDWLRKKSIRYDIWRKFANLDYRAEFRLKNSNIWHKRFLKGEVLENFVKLCAWYLSEGHKGLSVPIYISQADLKNKKEIVEVLKGLNSLGYIQESRKRNKTEKVYKVAGKGLLAEIIGLSCGTLSFNKVIPWYIFELSKKYQRLFIKTLFKGDASEHNKYYDFSTTSKKLSLSLCLLLAQNNIRFSVYTEKVSKVNENWRDHYIVRAFKKNSQYARKQYRVGDFEARVCLHKEEFIYNREFEYDISVDVPQENFVGGAGLLVFHNSPFSNITLDLKPSPVFANQPVIIGGKPQKESYKEFEEEMKMFDKAFYEVMLEGDRNGRPFSIDGECFCPIKNSERIKLVRIGDYIDNLMKKRKPIFLKENNCQVLDVRDLNIKSLGLKQGKIGWQKINFLVRHPLDSILRIWSKGGFNIKVTPSHSVLVLKNGKIQSYEAAKLKKGDYLVAPKIVPLDKNRITQISLAEEFLNKGKEEKIYIREVFRKGDGKRLWQKRTYRNSVGYTSVFPLKWIKNKLNEFDLSKASISLAGSNIKISNFLPINKELVEFLGWYVAEGSAEINKKYGGVSLGFNLEKEKQMAYHLGSLVQKIFPEVRVSFREIKKRNLIELRIHSKLVRRIITEIFEIGNRTEKKVPQIIFELSPEMKKVFLNAYFRGDAWITKDIVVSSTSQELIYGVSTLLKQLGCFHTLTEYYLKEYPKIPRWRINIWGNRQLTSKDSHSISKVPIKESGLEEVVEKILAKEPYCYDSLGRKYKNTKARIFNQFGVDISASTSTSLKRVKRIIAYAKKFKLEIPSALKEIGKGNLLFFKIKRIEKVKSSNGMVYDFSTESENFVANQLLVHNTFPIPTINITKDFPWNEPAFDGIFESSAKHGTNYFANYINSEMKPEDVRSMCIDGKEELLIRNSKNIKRVSIKEIAEKYKVGRFDKEGWAECKKEGGLQVLSLNPETLKTEWSPVKRFLRIFDKEAIEITTEDGKKTIFSKKHPVPVFTEQGIAMKWSKDIKKGDYLLTLKKTNILSKRYQKIEDFVFNEDLAKILGYFTADGNYLFENRKGHAHYKEPRGMQFTFRTGDLENLSLIKFLIKKVFNLEGKEKQDPRYNSYYLYIYNSELSRKLYNAGFKKYGRLPQILFNSPASVIRDFLDFYFKGDGYKKQKEIHINDLELSRDLVLLYSLIGQPVTYRLRKRSQVIRLQHSKSAIKRINGWTNNPILSERIPGWMAVSTTKVPGLIKSRMVGFDTLEKYNAHTTESLKIKHSDIYLTRVKEIKVKKYKQLKEFYDIELKKNHLFVHSLGQISFNCCRLRLNLTDLHNRGGGGLFGSGSLTGCYDDKTEILTEDGWKFFKDLTKEDYVFTLTEDNRIELHRPRRLFEYDYQGKMIYFKSKSADLLVTPNHRMVVDHKGSLKRMFVEAKDFKPYQHYIPKGGVWEGQEKEYFELPPVLIMSGAGPVSRFSEEELESIRRMKREGKNIYQIAEDFNCNPVTVYHICTATDYGNRERLRIRYETSPLKIKMDDWLKFFGFWLAEGCTDNERIALSHGYRVVISQTNKKKREEIKEILDRLPFSYYEEKDNFIICNKQLWTYLRQFGDKYQKFIPKEIKSLSKRQLKILFDWMVKGDGHIRRTTGQINYWTSSKKLADDLQEIILKLGWMGTLTSQKKKVSQIKGRKIKAGTVYALGVQKTKHYVFRKKLIREVNYTGKVYCCEVPNHTVFVRRNGKVAWCGNSIGVVTMNLPRIGYLSKTKKEFFERLGKLMDLGKESLEIKRKTIENFIEKGLYPYSRFYLSGIKKARNAYYANHFSTIGLVGMNEALLNFLGEDIGSLRGRKFALEIMDFMRERLVRYQEETGNIYNLEQTPAESSLAPNEKVLVSQSDPKLVKIGSLIDKYLEKNKEKVQVIGRSEVLPLKKGELYTFGFSRKDQKIRKYPVTALIRHPGDSMYEIETVSGREIKVTKYHSVFTLNEKGIPQEVKVETLKRGEVIAIPKKIEMEIAHHRFNLIEEFRKVPQIREKLYLKTTSNFIEKLLTNERVKNWANRYYRFPFKDVKCWWRKRKTIPLKLIYDLNIPLEKEVLENSRIFYRKSKNTSPIKPLIPIDRDLGFILGVILAEGWIGEDCIEISNTNKNLIEEMESKLTRIFGSSSFRISLVGDKRGYKPLFNITLLKLPTCFMREILNLKGKSSKKYIPSFAYFSSNEFVGGFLKGFLMGDGNQYIKPENSDYNFRFYTNSRELKQGINLLLLKLGILAKIRVDRKDKVHPNWKKNYILSISGIKNLQKFYQLVLKKEFKGKLKNSGRERIPKVMKTLKSVIKKEGLKKKDLERLGIWQSTFDGCVRKNSISWHQLKEILEKLEKKIKNPILKTLKILIDGDLYWDPIKSIRKIKSPKYVYDFEVDIQGDLVQNFLGGEGLVCLHNTSYRLALKDKAKYPDIITAGTKENPYYTNSSQLPVGYTDDVFEALKLQDEITCKYTGGSVFHVFLGERMPDAQAVKNLVKRIFEKFHLPYITITPTFSICPVHGYLSGEHFECPKCVVKQPCEVYSRVVGYLRPVNQFNVGKQQEFKERKEFKV